MIIRNFNNVEKKENPYQVDVRPLYNYASAQIMHITLQPGEGLKPHKTPVDVAFYVLEGTPTIRVGDEHETVVKDNLVESPADIIHNINNEGEEEARILVIKAPRPEKATKVL